MLNAFVGWIAKCLATVGGLAIVAIMLLVTADVGGRYLFNNPIPGTIEIVSIYFMVAVALLTQAETERSGETITVDLLVSSLPEYLQRAISVLGMSLCVVFLAITTHASWKYALKKFNVGEYAMGYLNIPIWPSRFMVPLGFGALALVLVVKVARRLRNKNSEEPQHD